MRQQKMAMRTWQGTRWREAFLRLVAAAIACATPGLAAAGEGTDDWQLVQEEDGITVYTRRSEGAENLAFRGIVTVPQSVEEIEAVLRDTKGYAGWYARCEAATTLESHPPSWRLVHMKIDLPFPVSDRDAVVRVDREPQGERLVLRLTTAAAALPEQDGYVRMARADGAWALEPVPDGGTRITLEQHNDPGGAFPTWLSNLLVTDQPTRTLAGLRETLAARSDTPR